MTTLFPMPANKDAQEIYALYPRKAGGKAMALRSILIAMKNYTATFLKERTAAFAKVIEDRGVEKQFVPLPTTFFNQERFADDYEEMYPARVMKTKQLSIGDLRSVLKAKTDARDKLRMKFRDDGPTGNTWTNEPARQQAVQLGKEIEVLNKQLAGMA